MKQRHTRYRWTNILGLTVLAGLLLTTAACGDAFIDPFDNDNRFFSIYGFIDEAKNFEPGAEHAVRVIPLSRLSGRITTPTDAQAFIDAVVTSMDVRTGVIHRWNYKLEQLSDGTFAHIFRRRFFVQPGRTYRLQVRRSDGVTAAAETKVPASGGIEAILASPRVDPVSGTITQEIHLTQVPSPWDIDVIYHVGSDFTATPFPLSYGRPGTPTDDGGWRFTVNITEDLGRLSNLLGMPVSTIRIPAMGLKIRLLDGNWTPPEGVFDPEVLAQPGTLSNIENGYGFWGSVGLYQHDWAISDELRDLLGF
ncbi:MAG: hypothetical protein ACE10K_12130 [Rhodothermales bacterium]